MPAYVLKCEGWQSWVLPDPRRRTAGSPKETTLLAALSHLPLNHQLTGAGGRLVRAATKDTGNAGLQSLFTTEAALPAEQQNRDRYTNRGEQTASPFPLINTPLSGLTPDAVIGS